MNQFSFKSFTFLAIFSMPLLAEPSGKRLYLEKGCQTCHGVNGAGNGPVADSGIDPKPGDFRRELKYGEDMASIVKVISDGIPNTAMPGYSEVLTDKEIERLAKYIKTFKKKRR